MLHYFRFVFLTLVLQTILFSSYDEKDNIPFRFTKLSKLLEIYECDHFLSDEECEYIIEKAKPTLTRSTVIDPHSPKELLNSDRTSFGTFLSQIDDPIIQDIRYRLESITGISEKNGESLQVLHYGIGAEYKPHFDFFDLKTPGGLAHYNRGGQRIATLLLYLNTPANGGETIFPRIDLSVKAIKGKGVLFFNVDEMGIPYGQSLHGGTPVIAGEKWIATIWLREREFQ